MNETPQTDPRFDKLLKFHETVLTDEVIAEVESRRPDGRHAAQWCLYAAFELAQALQRRGIQARFQAGSAFWRIDDDNAEFPWFGYEFDESDEVFEQQILRIINAEPGQFALPEMHCWVAIPDQMVIIDPTIADQPEQCRELLGKPWNPDICPPPGTWGVLFLSDLTTHQFARYSPSINAIRLSYCALGMPPPTKFTERRPSEEASDA